MDKKRPAIIVHRDFAGRALASVLVAPLTTTVRSIPTEVPLSEADGLDRDCVASLDNLTLLRKSRLLQRLGRIPGNRMDEVCAALAIAVGCRLRDQPFEPGRRPRP